jgi:N-acetylglucosaminyldiphosphoundecaprenol N-acetyl-beta-D-mannosaminyltransferase
MQSSSAIEWPSKFPLCGVKISSTNYNEAVDRIITAAQYHIRAKVTPLAVHGLVLASRDPSFRSRLHDFDLVVPDGQPVRLSLNFLYGQNMSDRVYGPELMLRLCRRAAETGVGVYLYGSYPDVVGALHANLARSFPSLKIVGYEPSVFRPLTQLEDKELIERINSSGAGLLFLGLGCPLQEVFAHEHSRSIQAVQVCVGAAFDFHAGRKKMAPAWMQRNGLEWLYRLMQEPRRLWRRYLVTNSIFLIKVVCQFIDERVGQ